MHHHHSDEKAYLMLICSSRLWTSLALTVGYAVTLGSVGCSTKPAEPDTAEVAPDPAIKPVPAATPPAVEGATSAPAGEPKP